MAPIITVSRELGTWMWAYYDSLPTDSLWLTVITEWTEVQLTPNKKHILVSPLALKFQRSHDPRYNPGGLRGTNRASNANVLGPVALHCWERALKRLSPLRVPATVTPVRSTKGHNENIYFEAAQDSRLNWALLNLEKRHTREAGLRLTPLLEEGQGS